jgi:hypothetical protein
MITSGLDRATVFHGLPEEFAVGSVREGSILVTDEITAQELQKILLMALECLNSGKINKATADWISDAANFALSAIRSAPKHESLSERHQLKVASAVGALRQAEEMLARLSKPPAADEGRRSPPKKHDR